MIKKVHKSEHKSTNEYIDLQICWEIYYPDNNLNRVLFQNQIKTLKDFETKTETIKTFFAGINDIWGTYTRMG